MNAHHTMLLRQLKRLDLSPSGAAPTAEQWSLFLDRVSSAYAEADRDHYLLARSQEVSASEVRQLYRHLDDAQKIAGLGDWSYASAGGLIRCSRVALDIAGFDADGPMPSHRGLLRRLPADARQLLMRQAADALALGTAFETELRLVLPGGATRWVWLRCQGVPAGQGASRQLIGTVMDITRRKQAEQRLALEHAVAGALAKADGPEQAMPQVIQAICQALHCQYGVLWMHDRKLGSLTARARWHAPGTSVAQLQYACAHPKRLMGESPAGAAPEASLAEAFALTLGAEQEVFGILQFFARRRDRPDAAMQEALPAVSRLIGQYILRQRAELALRESEQHFRALVDQASGSLYVHDAEGRLIDVNQRGCDCLGYTRQELLAMRMEQIDAGGPRQRPGDQALHFESHYLRRDGSSFPVEVRTGPIDVCGRRHYLSLVLDVTERKQLQDHIQHLAYHDTLTNLPNRAMFQLQLSHAVAQARRYGKRLAVLFIDLDRFKMINDTLGHDAGDQLLQEMSQRITHCLRQGDMMARLGGDEFVVLIEELADAAQVGTVAQKILTAMAREYTIAGQPVHVTGSIGISQLPDDASSETALVQHADMAMYRAKAQGKNKFQFYSQLTAAPAQNTLCLESDLHYAVERGELLMHYQAKVEAGSGRITGLEALVRWRHPVLGLISPAQFIPLAEESGLIVPVSKWVLEEVCRQLQAWRAQGLAPLRAAVNLSPRQFADDALLPDTLAILRQYDMDPALLEFEITESMMMDDAERTIAVLKAFRAEGIRIAIDDFGIAYSSLSHLKQFPVDTMKIDQVFIRGIPGDLADRAIVDAIIAMAKSLKLKLVAEGVEVDEQLQFLLARDCDEIQGFLFSRPLPPDEFADLLRQNAARFGGQPELVKEDGRRDMLEQQRRRRQKDGLRADASALSMSA